LRRSLRARKSRREENERGSDEVATRSHDTLIEDHIE
jgi:hypothetical protein